MKKLQCLLLSFGFLFSVTACANLGVTPFENGNTSAFEETPHAAECTKDGNKIIIKVTKNLYARRIVLQDVMSLLKEQGELSYEMKDGMLTTLNGVSNTATSYWMLYTSAADYANTAWGAVEYNGATYGSAFVGVKALPAVEGETYIWSYETPAW